jgi:chemotaxis methyl-accepting protein methylase
VARLPEIAPVPGGPPEAAGLATVGGRSMAALDLAALLGVRRAPPRSGVLVVFEGSVPFGLLADSVTPAQVLPMLVAGDLRTGGERWHHRGVLAEADGELLPILHVEQVASILDGPLDGNDRLDVQLSRQLARVEASLEAHGLQLSPRLRGRLRIHIAGAARELGLGVRALIPEILGGDPASICGLLEEIVLGETFFFRHPEQFRALRRLLFASADPGRTLRLWSAGASSGEEAWSLVTLLARAGRRAGRDRVLATDVSERALAHAREGRYGRWSFRGVDAEMEAGLPGAPRGTEIPAALRGAVETLVHDLRTDAPEGGFDAVLCRNVLSFLAPADAAAAVPRLLGAVRPGGYLVLAPSEAWLADDLGAERVASDGALLLRRPWSRTAGTPAPSPAPRPRGRSANGR